MRLLRLLTWIALFCIDVHVKADELSTCWGKKIPCPIQAGAKVQVVEAAQTRLALAPESLLEQRGPSTIQLISGQFYVETAKPIRFQTPYAKLWCEQECKALIERLPASVNVKSLEGRWLIERIGESQVYALKAGLQISLSEVSDDGLATMEFPQSLPWLSTVKQWAGLYPDKPNKLKEELVKFRSEWKEAVEAVSSLHFQEASRSIASNEKWLAEERARQKAREREDQSLRSLFREKNFLNP